MAITESGNKFQLTQLTAVPGSETAREITLKHLGDSKLHGINMVLEYPGTLVAIWLNDQNRGR